MRRKIGTTRASVVMLLCLFAMSVTAVEIWQVERTRPETVYRRLRQVQAKAATWAGTMPEAQPAPPQWAQPAQRQELKRQATERQDVIVQHDVQCTSRPRVSVSLPIAESPMPCSIPKGDVQLVGSSAPATAEKDEVTAVATEFNEPTDCSTEQTATKSPTAPAGLVDLTTLHHQLESLQSAPASAWRASVKEWLTSLQTETSWSTPNAGRAIQQLALLADDAHLKDLSAEISDSAEVARLRIAAYAIERRTDVWKRVHLALQPIVMNKVNQEKAYCARDRMLQTINAAERLFPNTPAGKDWRAFLGIGALRETVVAQTETPNARQIPIAAEVLRKIASAELSSEQQKYFQTAAIKGYIQLLHRLVTNPIVLKQLAECIERVETDPSQVTGGCLALHWQELRWATIPEYRQIADAINLHYRNANLRLCVSSDFLNRFLPAMEHVRAPVTEEILGANVTGQSDTLNKLHVRFVPDSDEVRLKLEVKGLMNSNTRSTSGGVTMFNQNRSNILMEKVFAFNPGGLRVGSTQANAQADTNLRGVVTKYDGVPLFGPMFQRIARQRHQENKPAARRIIENRVAKQFRARADAKLEEQMAMARQRLEHRIVKPLQEMELEPEALSMQTTEDRIIVRGRLAGGDQIAAFTARPRAISENLFSMQIHESAMNNLIDRLKLDGRTVEMRQLVRELLDQWEMKDIPVPAEIPENVQLTLAEERPIEICCENDQVVFRMRINRLSGERGTWRNFEIAAHFVPETEGFRCDLVRAGTLEINSTGNRPLSVKNRFAISAIFTRVFSKNQRLQMINAELSNDPRLARLDVDQVVIRDGWIGISVGEKTPLTAATPTRNVRR